MDAIEEQLQEGESGLRDEDKWLMEVDLDDLTSGTNGEREVYWLLAVRAARERYRLQASRNRRRHGCCRQTTREGF